MSRHLTTQDISWLLDLNEKQQLDLDPPYQRRSVWSLSDKRYFIDTILNNYPAPPIFLHKTIDDSGRSTYHVIDGKQRLLTIIDFTKNLIRIPDDFGDVNLQSKHWDEMERSWKERLWNYSISVEFLNDVDNAQLREVFDRINRNSRKLTRQELRHAKYDGWFINFAEAESKKTEWKNYGLSTTASVKRMADVQFISELLAITLNGKIVGFNQNTLDKLYAEYEDISENSSLIEDDFINIVEYVKKRISNLLQIEPTLKDYLKVRNHFYTLWAYLTIERQQNSEDKQFAKTYKKFLDIVTKHLDASPNDIDSQTTPNAEKFNGFNQQDIVNYAKSARGASTDLAPRKNRYNALSNAIHEQEDNLLENC